MSGVASERSASEPAASGASLHLESEQVMGSTQSVFTGLRAGAQTRSVSRGRAGATESTRSPLSASANGGGIESIWMGSQEENGVPDSSSSGQVPAAVDSTAQMQAQFEEMRTFMREQAAEKNRAYRTSRVHATGDGRSSSTSSSFSWEGVFNHAS